MRLLAPLRLLACLLVFIVAPLEVAFAHAQLLSTTPIENAVVDPALDLVELKFNEPVSPLTITLIAPDGTSRNLIDAATGGETTIVDLPAVLQNGTHVLSWRVVSTDGHPIGGSLVFSIGEVSRSAISAPAADSAVAPLLWASKALLFIALFGGVGGAAFSAFNPLPKTGRRIALSLALLGVIVAILTLGLQGLDALGLPLAEITASRTWSTGYSTSYGATAIAAAVALMTASISLLLPQGAWSVGLSLIAATIAALSLALSGHASAAAPQWLTRPAVFLHVAGVLFWAGALVPLWLLLRERSDRADKALAAFSRLIPFAVAPLAISGVMLAGIQMGPPGSHWATPYGFILAAKAGLLIALFTLALWNRRRLTEPALAGDTLARLRLRRSVGWEMVIVLAILGLVAGWRFTPPPRALAETPVLVAAEPIMTHLIDDRAMAVVTISPGAAGPVSIDLEIMDLEHNPMDAQSVSITMTNRELGIEPISRDAIAEDNIWRVENMTIPVVGAWEFVVEARISRFELARPQGEILIPWS